MNRANDQHAKSRVFGFDVARPDCLTVDGFGQAGLQIRGLAQGTLHVGQAGSKFVARDGGLDRADQIKK